MRASQPRRTLLLGLIILAGLALPADAAELSLKRVLLSSAGVGYFEYEAEVEGNAELSLDVPLEQVDDILKSLVVFDSAGGVGGVTLPGHDDSRAAFGDVPFGPQALQSPLAYLSALRGVELDVQGPRPMRGRLMQAHIVNEVMEDGGRTPPRTIQRTRVSLMTADGMRQFVLEDAESVQIADPVLRARVGRALEAVRRASGREVRQLKLHTSGAGKRVVRVGYVAAAPLWKISYRLVLPAEGAAKARLQGWATLENESGADWNNVALTLQYGNPVTFRQALYRSYFVERPEVPVEVLGRILPHVDRRSRPLAAKAAQPAPAAPGRAAGAAQEMRDRVIMPQSTAGAAPMDNMAAPADEVLATEGAEQTIFRLHNPVLLRAGHSASIPILDQEVAAERLSLATGTRTHPLASVRVENATGVSLPAGVLTLYDPAGEAAFAGDARLGGLPGGEKRLLSFAEDLRTSVERQVSIAQDLVSISAAQGVLRLTSRNRRTMEILLTAPVREARQVLLEIPKDGDRALAIEGGAITGTEETTTAWRLPIALKPGETRSLVAYLDRTLHEEIALLGNNIQPVLVRALASRALPPATRAALEGLAKLRQDEDSKRAEMARLTREIEAVERDEDRIRRNLQAVRQGDALHTRLTRQLDADETRIAALRDEMEVASKAAEAARKALADAVAALRL